MTLTRRDTLVLAATAALATASGLGVAQAQEGTTKDLAALADVAVPDRSLGSDTAPVTMIEYASPTCPHCASFHNTVYPQFKTEYIDTGKVKFIVRPFLRNIQDAVIFLLAEAADGAEQYYSVIETYFKTQAEWSMSERPRDALLAVALQMGFTEESFDAALTNTPIYDAMEAMREQALSQFNLEGTPTFYINGKQLTGSKTIEDLRAVIDPLVPADFKPTTAAATPADGAATEAAPATDTAAEAPAEGTTTTTPQ